MTSITKPEAQAESLAFCGQRVLNNCHLHGGSVVHFDGDPASCPACKERYAHAETRGALWWYKEEIDRLKKVEQDNVRLQSRIRELEDLLPEEEDLDDPPLEEPRRPEDMGARHGTEVTPRTWAEGGGS